MVSRLLIVALIIVGSFLLLGCKTTTHVKPIYISKDDIFTKGTASQILVHNESVK